VNYQRHIEGVRAIRSDRERIAGLLDAYPDIGRRETDEILSYLKTARHLDVGLLSSDTRISGKLDQFMAEHKSHFQIGIGETVGVISAIVAILAIGWLIWEAFQ
jgi:hypothetical protein